MPTGRKDDLDTALQFHAEAASLFATAALNLSAEQWLTSNAKKWSAAEVTEHLTLVYEVLLRELEGGTGMKIVTNFWQKALARWLFLPGILRGSFPKGARAPKETRPAALRADQKTAIEIFQDLAMQFQKRVLRAYEQNPATHLTHAYFGTYPLDTAVLVCAQHIRHHSNHLQS